MTATSLSSSLSPCLFHSVTAIIQVIFFLGGFGSAAGLASLEASWFSSTVSIHDDSNQRCRWQTQDICCVCFQHPLRIPSSYRRNKIGLLTTWKCDLQNFDQIAACQDPIQLHFHKQFRLCQRCIKLVRLSFWPWFTSHVYPPPPLPHHTLISEAQRKSFEITELHFL